MDKSKLRYTKDQLKSLGYPLEDRFYEEPVLPNDPVSLDILMKGDFKDVLDIVFSTMQNGRVPNLFELTVSENLPDDVKQFLLNLQNNQLPQLSGAETDDEAFALICPKSVQGALDKSEYRDQILAYARTHYVDPDKPIVTESVEQPKPE